MRPNRTQTALALAMVISLIAGCQPARQQAGKQPPTETEEAAPEVAASRTPQPINDPRLHNAFRLTSGVISGAEPDEQGFAALKELGVQTIISVDGATPDVELAHKYGLRYVHLPFGYDGISAERVQELAKAVMELPGPVFIHCHHGQHRSPAAAASACVVAGLIGHDQAQAALAAAGTSTHYTGLFEAVENAHPLDAALLAELRVEYPETAQIPPLAEAMVAIEHTFDRLRQCAAARWRPPPNHPDIDPPHEALLLTEHFLELARTKDAATRTEEFWRFLDAGERQATDLETELRRWFEAGRPEPSPKALAAGLSSLKANCQACHARYRDVPPGGLNSPIAG